MERIHQIFTQLTSPSLSTSTGGYSEMEESYHRILESDETVSTCVEYLSSFLASGGFHNREENGLEDLLWSCSFTLHKALKRSWENRPKELQTMIREVFFRVVMSYSGDSESQATDVQWLPRGILMKLFSTLTLILKYEWGSVEFWEDYFPFLRGLLESDSSGKRWIALTLQKMFVEDCIVQIQSASSKRKEEIRWFFLHEEVVNSQVVVPTRKFLESTDQKQDLILTATNVIELCIIAGYRPHEEDMVVFFQLMDSQVEDTFAGAISCLIEIVKGPDASFVRDIVSKLRETFSRDLNSCTPGSAKKLVNLVYEIVSWHLLHVVPEELLPLLSLFFKQAISWLAMTDETEAFVSFLDVWESLADTVISNPDLLKSYTESLIFVAQTFTEAVEHMETLSRLSLGDGGSQLVFKLSDIISRISTSSNEISSRVSTHPFSLFAGFIVKLREMEFAESALPVFAPLRIAINICGCVYASNVQSGCIPIEADIISSFVEDLFSLETFARVLFLRQYASENESAEKTLVTQILVEVARGLRQTLPFLGAMMRNNDAYSDILSRLLELVTQQVGLSCESCQGEALQLFTSLNLSIRPDSLPKLEQFNIICSNIISDFVIPMYSVDFEDKESNNRFRLAVELRSELLRGVMYAFINANAATNFLHLAHPLMEHFQRAKNRMAGVGDMEKRSRACKCMANIYTTITHILRGCTGKEDRKVIRQLVGDLMVDSVNSLLDIPEASFECIESASIFLLALFETLRREVEPVLLWDLAVPFLQKSTKSKFMRSRVIIPTAFQIAKTIVLDKAFYGPKSVDFIEEFSLSSGCTGMIVGDGENSGRISHIEGYRSYFELLRELFLMRSGKHDGILSVLLQSLTIVDIEAARYNLETLRLACDRFNIFAYYNKDIRFMSFEALLAVGFTELYDLVKEETAEILFFMCTNNPNEFFMEFLSTFIDSVRIPSDRKEAIRSRHISEYLSQPDLPTFKFTIFRLISDIKCTT